MRTVVVVGAGLAGVRCAETLRAAGYDGRVVLLGDEAYAPYERPALSKEYLAGERDELALRPPGHWNELDIELVLGARVDGIRGRMARAGARSWAFDRVVLATGARPRALNGIRPPWVQHLRTLDDARALRDRLRPGRRLVVVGSGFVGAEVATTAARLGVEVTVVEAGVSPLGGLLGREVGSVLEAAYRRRGIDLRLGVGVERVDRRATVLADGTRIVHDVVLVAVGVDPARDLGARSAIEAGDVTGVGHWTAAAEQGVAAAHRLLGLVPPCERPRFVWSDQLGYRLQVVGSTRDAFGVSIEGDDASFVARYLDARDRVLGAVAANRPEATAALRQELATVPSAA
jgi:NADPH-dependent 2,4-dienoyl-CoA reductase/sulfur reductase-like enzyme